MPNDPQVPCDPQVPWTDEQWARVNQVVQEEASRARVAATFLPLIGPLPRDTDFVREEIIPAGPPLTIRDKQTIQLATLQVQVPVRGAQMADPDMVSVLGMFRRAANVLARLEDTVVFRGLVKSNPDGLQVAPPLPLTPPDKLPPAIWEIQGGQESNGLLAPEGSLKVAVRVPAGAPPDLVRAVSDAIGQLEENGHFGPFAVVLDQEYFLAVQTPTHTLVLPQDRIIPFLGGGPLLRSSTLPDQSGVVVGLGGNPVELVIATDVRLQFLQVSTEPLFVFRVFEKMALRIKEANAIATLAPSTAKVLSVSPRRGKAGTAVDIRGINFAGATDVRFGPTVITLPRANVSDTLITVTAPQPPAPPVHIEVDVGGAWSPTSPADVFTYV